MRKPIPLLGGQSVHQVAKIKDEQTINFYPKAETPDAKSLLTLLGTPGLTKITTIGTGPARSNMVTWNSKLYGISGNTLYSKDTSDVIATLGTLSTSSGWCVIAVGRTMIMIVDGANGYTWNGTTFASITSGNFPSDPSHCDYLNGYFLVNSASSDQWQISAVEDATTWAALDFATAEASSDNVDALIVNGNDIVTAGSLTIQQFYPVNSPDFPFTAYTDVLQYGIDAKYSAVACEFGIFFLGRTHEGLKSVYLMSGFTILPITDDDMNATIGQMTTTTDAIGGLTSYDGQVFYVLTFPSEDVTYAVNIKTKFVHRLKSYGIGRHRAIGYGSLNGRNFVGDYDNAKLYQLQFSEYTEDGGVIERYRRSQVISAQGDPLNFHEVVLDVQAGVGNASSANPIIQLRYSDDAGNSWSSWLDASLGAVGEYTTRCSWRRLGSSPNRVFEFRITDPVASNIIDAYAQVSRLYS